jgi:cytoskeletal protein RodZ
MMENLSESIDISLSIGNLLKEQREKKGCSLQRAAEQTRIRKNFLESIENNQFSDLPGRVYVTGFIRVYASYLGLDGDTLLLQLKDVEIGDGRTSLKPISHTKSPLKSSRKPSSSGVWKVFVGFFLTVLILGIALYYLYDVFQPKAAVVTSVPQIETSAVPVSTVPIHTQIDVTSGANKEPMEVVIPAQKADSAPIAVAVQPPERDLLPPVAQGGSSLRMLALTESSLTIQLDKRMPHKYKLYNGLDLTWKIKEQITVDMAKPGLARFWLDGLELALDGLNSFQLQPAPGE